MKSNDIAWIQTEVHFNKARYGEKHRAALISLYRNAGTELKVEFDTIPQAQQTEKLNVNAALIDFGTDYSELLPGIEFLITEKQIVVGKGKVLSVNDFDFTVFPKFQQYLTYKITGLRKEASRIIEDFLNDLSDDCDLKKRFSEFLCALLDAYHYKQFGCRTIICGHWFNEKLKNFLYEFFAPQIKTADQNFSYAKWYCLYARSYNMNNNFNLPLCKTLLEQCDYRDKLLTLYYVNQKLSTLYYNIHELPFGYLGEDPREDLKELYEIRKILNKCFKKDFDTEYTDLENEITNYIDLKNKDGNR